MIEIARQGLGEERDRRPHQDRAGQGDAGGQRQVEREGEGTRDAGQAQGGHTRDVQQRHEGEGVEADGRLHRAVGQQQAPRLASCGPGQQTLRDAPEQGVARRQPAEEEAQHGGGRCAVGAEQGGQELLPGHLVDEAGEAGQRRQQQRQASGRGLFHRPLIDASCPS